MPVSLLRSKIFPPPLRSDLVPRPHLLDLLEAGIERKMTLVSGPAGFGKSTIVGAWTATHSRVGWLALDTADDDLRRFLRYLSASLSEIKTSLGAGLAEILEAPRLPDSQTLVARLTDSMHDSERFLLVLDDYHAISNPAIHNLVEVLLAYQPPPLHLVIATREDPPLPLTRLRARGQLTEIRAQELRFNGAEARAFLSHTMGLSLAEAQIETLKDRTEGWIAGLQLAALSLQRSSDPEAFVTAFAGNDRYVLDYLMDEVFTGQPKTVQQFLLQTSVLERLSTGLCAAVVEIEGLADDEISTLLGQLESNNLFILPQDNRRAWYRYHHLFADLLRFRLEREQPELALRLHQRASRWYEDNGYLRDAVRHARAAGTDRRVAELLGRHGAAFFAANEMKAVHKWIEALSPAVRDVQPALLMVHAWATLSTGQPEAAAQSLDKIESIVGRTAGALADDGQGMDAKTRGALAEVAVMRAVMAVDRQEAKQAVALAQAALAALEQESITLFHTPPDLKGIALSPLASAYEMLGNATAARAALVKALAISREEENVHITALARSRLGRLSALRGNLQEAESHFRAALASPAGRRPSPYRGVAHAGLGAVHYERNELVSAAEHFRQAISLARPVGHWETLIPAHTGLARLAVAKGELETAWELLDDLARLRHRFRLPDKVAEAEALRIRIQLHEGLVEAATRRARHFPAADTPPPPLQELRAMVQARVRLAQDKTEAALALLATWPAQAEADGRRHRLLALWLLQALTLEAAGHREEALRLLAPALEIGQAAGYVRLFLDEGEPAARLLYAAAAAGVAPAYSGRLLDAYQFSGDEPDPAAKLVEPLTPREEEVLAAVAEGLTNREIAQELSIALGTVKTHTANIYGKLGVGNRMEAVARSRSLGIL